VRLDDADELVTVIERNLTHLEPWMGWVHPYQPGSTVMFLEAALRQARDDQGAQFVVVRAGDVVGTIGFHGINWVNRVTSIGYWLDAGAQGRGIVTAAVRVLSALAFEEWRLHRIELRAAPANARSQAVAQRCGFVYEGVARGAELVAGEYRDLAVYSLLASDPRSTFRER
jgi:ribosomal-protein-serine acetyltransferase